jgi:predicted nuclease with TOPRIM domain
MSHKCRLRSYSTIGVDGKWAADRIEQLEAERDDWRVYAKEAGAQNVQLRLRVAELEKDNEEMIAGFDAQVSWRNRMRDQMDALKEQRADLFESLVALSATVSTLCSWDRRFDEVLDAADASVARVKTDHFRDATKMIEGASE